MTDSGKKLRVGFDARWHNDSGVGRYVAELAGAMARAQQVNLVLYEDARAPVPGLEGRDVERIAVSSGRYSVAGQIELGQRMRRDGLDVFHSPFYVVLLGASCPVVVTIHDLIPFLFPVYGPVKSVLVKAGYRIAARKAAQIITVSKNTAADVQRVLNVGAARISVVHNAAASVFHPQGQQDELTALQEKYGVKPPYVVAASARNWRTKNLEGALQALAAAQSAAPFQTVIYGPKEGMRAASGGERWKSLDLRVIGQVEASELAVLFRNARAFMCPSLYEGFGLPVVEAMACGCPVITSNAGSLAEVAGDGAQIFDASDVKSMAAAVEELLSDEACVARWRQAALRRAENFSWEKAARETIAVYHRAYNACERSKTVASSG
jgi:glycosyltransferase involved in cell wall biosynthesis